MKKSLLTGVIAGLVLGAAGAPASELPTFEAKGFLISPRQVSLVDPVGVREQAATPALMRADTPASALQLLVLTRRSTTKVTSEATVGPTYNQGGIGNKCFR